MEMHEIVIVKGDSYSCEIELQNLNLDIDLVEIYFSCEKLKICEKLKYDEINNTYFLEFTPSETEKMEVGIYDYDFTINMSGSLKTFQYKSTIVILEKNNKVVCYG